MNSIVSFVRDNFKTPDYKKHRFEVLLGVANENYNKANLACILGLFVGILYGVVDFIAIKNGALKNDVFAKIIFLSDALFSALFLFFIYSRFKNEFKNITQEYTFKRFFVFAVVAVFFIRSSVSAVSEIELYHREISMVAFAFVINFTLILPHRVRLYSNLLIIFAQFLVVHFSSVNLYVATNEFLILFVVVSFCHLIGFFQFNLWVKNFLNIKTIDKINNVLKDSNIRLKQSETRLLETNKNLEHFAYIVSHDLKEPMRITKLYAEFLLIKKAYPEIEDKLLIIKSNVERMNGLMEDLLEYSRIGRSEASKTRIDLNEILKNVQDNLKERIDDSYAQIRIQSLPVVYGNAHELTRLFQNLISNAIKFSKNTLPPIVNIGYKKHNDFYYEFYVQDNGIGLKQEHHQKIFNMFNRVTEKAVDGNGIGLTICKKIVEENKGTIWVESQYEVGATFRFTFPIPRD